MKNIKISKYMGILLFITMLSLIVIASTYAKYTSNLNGTGSATATDWNVSIDGTASEGYDFTLTASSEKIYPGATGIFLGDIVVNNDSTIVSAAVTSIGINLTSDTETPNINLTYGNYSETIEAGGSISIPVYATWEYDSVTDETDFAGDTFSFDIELTVDQVVSQ